MVMLTLTALLVVPGLIVGLAARLPLRLAVGTSIPVSAGIITIATYAYGRSGVLWSLGAYAVATAVTAVIVGLVGLLISGTLWFWRRRRGRDSDSRRSRPRRSWWWLLPAASVVVSAWLIGQMILTELSATPGGTANVFQGWDAHWHANYLRFIHDTGLASPDQAGELRYPENGATLYYPSTWHAVAALVMGLRGIGAVEAYNLVQIGTMAMAFPLGVAALAWLITHRRFSRPAVATSAAVAAMATPLFPGLPFVEVMVAATPSGVANGLAGLVAAVV
ncbi:hypothetical protein G6027_13750, partial [Dietzia sp. SLG310A2-38A2]|uniref:DUF6541 family protein n=1 Tax=Dietzia sp. SLG310A2-38A2 TaxID=1630643 RepID=UPI00321ADA45|nr:hypothetical protein [Dietzia sp. SLG310A2-38A2]